MFFKSFHYSTYLSSIGERADNWKIWKKSKLKCEMIWKIWKIQNKIVKRLDKYGRNPSRTVKRFGKYGRKES
jgi:hypothetical protein